LKLKYAERVDPSTSFTSSRRHEFAHVFSVFQT
jgi:hypothetical protein